jgi:hypothetical protein
MWPTGSRRKSAGDLKERFHTCQKIRATHRKSLSSCFSPSVLLFFYFGRLEYKGVMLGVVATILSCEGNCPLTKDKNTESYRM